jgi:DNA-binding transcriptional MerR regulator
MNTYSTREAARLARVSRRQLTHWADCGYVQPSRTNAANGRGGIHLVWPAEQIERAQLLGLFSRVLVSHKSLARMAAALDADLTGLTMRDGGYELRVEIRPVAT